MTDQPKAKKSVMIVEDDYDIAAAITELLSDAGYDALTASNGAEALDLLKKGSRPNLILLDLMMPIMDGFEFREQQLNEPQIAHIPVIVMSADGNVVTKQMRARAKAYLKKPLDISELMALVTSTA